MNAIYEECFGRIDGLPSRYQTGDWYVVEQLNFSTCDQRYDYRIIGPFATSEEAVANGKIQTVGRTYIFQIRDTEPK